MLEHSEIDDDDNPDKNFEDHQELDLGDQIRFAGFIDQLRDLQHRLMYWQILELVVHHEAEQKAKNNNDEAIRQQIPSVDGTPEKPCLVKVGHDEICLAAGFSWSLSP